MTQKNLRNTVYLLVAALIWGTAFVCQSTGADAIGPYSFNCIRFIIGGIVLLPVIKIFDRLRGTRYTPSDLEKLTLKIGGLVTGVLLFLASTVQQLGIYYGHSTAKAGFLTAIYIIIVPIIGIFFKKKCGFNIWIGVVLALVGLYFITGVGSGEGIEAADGLLILCSFLFALQILALDYYSPRVDSIRLCCIEFFVCGVLGLIPLSFEMGYSLPEITNWMACFQNVDAWIAILYCGILSSGVAYTLQGVAMGGINPTVASLLMSLEAVFATIAGGIILGERLSLGEAIGCILIFVAIIVAQLDIKVDKK